MRWADRCRIRPGQVCQYELTLRLPQATAYLKNTRPPHPRSDLGVLLLLAPTSARNTARNDLDEVHAALPALEATLVRARHEIRVGVDVLGALGLTALVLGGNGLALSFLAEALVVLVVLASLRKLEARVEQVAAEEGGAFGAAGVREWRVGEACGKGLDLEGVLGDARCCILCDLPGRRARCCGWAGRVRASPRPGSSTQPRTQQGRRPGGSRPRRLRPPGWIVRTVSIL